jgi:hypothetical protein
VKCAYELIFSSFAARDEDDLGPAMELIQMSYDHFAADGQH